MDNRTVYKMNHISTDLVLKIADQIRAKLNSTKEGLGDKAYEEIKKFTEIKTDKDKYLQVSTSKSGLFIIIIDNGCFIFLKSVDSEIQANMNPIQSRSNNTATKNMRDMFIKDMVNIHDSSIIIAKLETYMVGLRILNTEGYNAPRAGEKRKDIEELHHKVDRSLAELHNAVKKLKRTQLDVCDQ